MEKTFSVENDQLKVTKSETTVTENFYDIGYLKNQRNTIQAQKDRENEMRDQELAEVDELIAEAEKAGLEEVVPEDVPEEELEAIKEPL